MTNFRNFCTQIDVLLLVFEEVDKFHDFNFRLFAAGHITASKINIFRNKIAPKSHFDVIFVNQSCVAFAELTKHTKRTGHC